MVFEKLERDEMAALELVTKRMNVGSAITCKRLRFAFVDNVTRDSCVVIDETGKKLAEHFEVTGDRKQVYTQRGDLVQR